MPTHYVIQEISYSYNDEVYYSDNDGGIPVVAYTTKVKAKAECERLNRKKLLKEEPGQYCYALNEILTKEGWATAKDLAKIVTKRRREEEEDENLQAVDPDDDGAEYFWSLLTDEEKNLLLPHFTLEFYQVFEVETKE